MLRFAKRFAQRARAIEGCQGIGRHIANRLLGDGEQGLDVPPKLSARARVFSTGQGRKTDAARRYQWRGRKVRAIEEHLRRKMTILRPL